MCTTYINICTCTNGDFKHFRFYKTVICQMRMSKTSNIELSPRNISLQEKIGASSSGSNQQPYLPLILNSSFSQDNGIMYMLLLMCICTNTHLSVNYKECIICIICDIYSLVKHCNHFGYIYFCIFKKATLDIAYRHGQDSVLMDSGFSIYNILLDVCWNKI